VGRSSVKKEALTSFTCPRCQEPAEASTYGPCPACRTELKAEQFSVPNEYTLEHSGEYVPKMNVVPNAVATKE
jgi:hypothetical protein